MDTNRLTLYAGGSPGRMGLQLRGPCATIADAQELEQRLRRLLSTGITILWIDCRQLSYLNRTGQRALLNTERYARTVGATLFWCGLTNSVLEELRSYGMHLLMRILPATSYMGPVEFLRTPLH